MKYLKKFILNESVDQNELQEFCNSHLAYLLDRGFYCEIERISNSLIQYYSICIKKNKNNSRLFNSLFWWSDIKDDLIPFIIFLYKKYEVSSYDNNMNILDKHRESEYIKIGNHKLGFYIKNLK